MKMRLPIIAAICAAASQASAAPADTPATAYQKTVVCAANFVALQQNPNPDASGTMPDPGKLNMMAAHMRSAALASGKKIGRSQSDVGGDIDRQAGQYSEEFHRAKTPDELHAVQTRIGRSVLGCAFVGL